MGTRELPSAFSVEEWATVEVVDRDKEVVILDTVEEHVDKYIEFGGDMTDTHTNLPLGHVWHSERRTHPESGKDGIVVWYNLRGGTYETDNGRKEWINGKNHLSIGASAGFDGMECDGAQCYTKRGVLGLYEIALCETPANPLADVIEAYVADNMAIAKSCGCKKEPVKGQIVLKSLECHVFSNAESCTLQKVAKIMHTISVPHELIVTGNVVKAYANEEHQLPLMMAMDDRGLMFDYDAKDDSFIVKHKIDAYHRYRAECMFKGYTTGDYRLTDKMTKGMFTKLYDNDMITKNRGGWELKRPAEMEKGKWFTTEKGMIGDYWLELWYGKKIEISHIRTGETVVIEESDADALLQIWRRLLDDADFADAHFKLYKHVKKMGGTQYEYTIDFEQYESSDAEHSRNSNSYNDGGALEYAYRKDEGMSAFRYWRDKIRDDGNFGILQITQWKYNDYDGNTDPITLDEVWINREPPLWYGSSKSVYKSHDRTASLT